MEASKFQFTNPYMEEVAFQGSGEKSAEKDVPLSNTIRVQVKKDEKKHEASVRLIIKTDAGTDGELFKLVVKMVSQFRWKDLEDEKVDILLHQNAPALLLSYARPIIASITNASRFPTYNIPFLDFSVEPTAEKE